MGVSFLETKDTVAALSRGGVLLLGTDTLPGFHCRADDKEAVDRVIGIKGRDPGRPLLVLAGSLMQAQSIGGIWNPWQKEICEGCWPGPFSLILPAAPKLADRVAAGTGTVAIRVPDNKDLCRLILDVGVPLVSTSVNRQGDSPLLVMDEAWRDFGVLVDGAWQPPSWQGRLNLRVQASALVDLCGDRPQILREGPLAFPGVGEA